jgi:hypothetical protein
MRLKSIQEEAARLIRERGPVAALETIYAELRKVKRSKNPRLELYKAQVAMAVARQAGSLTVKDE